MASLPALLALYASTAGSEDPDMCRMGAQLGSTCRALMHIDAPRRRKAFWKRRSTALLRQHHHTDLDVLEACVATGADVNVLIRWHTDASPILPLMVAVYYRNEQLVDTLLQAGADVMGRTALSPLYNAFDNVRILRMLLDACPSALEEGPCERITSCYDIAAALGNADVVEEFVHRGYLQIDKDPLSSAILYGKIDVVRMLIQHGADVNSCQKSMLPLKIAIRRDHREIFDMLLDAGACVNNVEDPCCDWMTILSLAVRYYDHPLIAGVPTTDYYVRRLLECGADPNIRDPDGEPVIFCTTTILILGLLLDAGADVNTLWEGKTIYDKARGNNVLRSYIRSRGGTSGSPLRRFFGL